MTKTVVALFDDLESIYTAVIWLIEAGYPRADISLILNDSDLNYRRRVDALQDEGSMASEELRAGGGAAILRSLRDLLVGLSALDLPGVGAVIIGGPLAAVVAIPTRTGLADDSPNQSNGLLFRLEEIGVPQKSGQEFLEGIRQGCHLAIVNTPNPLSKPAVEIMNRHGAVDLRKRLASSRENGWENLHPFPGPTIPDPNLEKL